MNSSVSISLILFPVWVTGQGTAILDELEKSTKAMISANEWKMDSRVTTPDGGRSLLTYERKDRTWLSLRVVTARGNEKLSIWAELANQQAIPKKVSFAGFDGWTVWEAKHAKTYQVLAERERQVVTVCFLRRDYGDPKPRVTKAEQELTVKLLRKTCAAAQKYPPKPMR